MTTDRTEWTPLSASALAGVAELARRCVERDGGLPAAVAPAVLERRFFAEGAVAVGAFDGSGRPVACGAVRPAAGASVLVGLVDPDCRGRGLGSGLLDRLLAEVRTGGLPERVRVETEALTPDAEELFAARGLRRTFAEDVYRRPLTGLPPAAPLPPGIELAPWSEDRQGAFYRAYRESFADRPGFPGWTREEWVDWLVDDDFLPECSLVALTADGTPVGFVACAEGFLAQLGAAPHRRRHGLGRALATAALERLRQGGAAEVLLDVNVNNPASAALFRGLGFTPTGRRARFEPA